MMGVFPLCFIFKEEHGKWEAVEEEEEEEEEETQKLNINGLDKLCSY